MVGLEVVINGVVIGRMAAGPALDAVLESLAVGDAVSLRAVEAENEAEGREPRVRTELKGRRRGNGSVGHRHERLEVREVLRRADAFFARTGEWPTR